MNAFLGFVRKEFYHILRDRRTLLILFGMPAVQLLLFGFAIRNEVEDIRVAVIDRSNDSVTREIKERLASNAYFVVVAQLPNEEALEEYFQAGKVREAVVFERDFARRLEREGVAHVQIVTDASDPNAARTMQAYTSAVLRQYQQELGGGPGAQIVPAFRMWFNPQMKSVYLFVPGLMAFILMLVSTLMTSITITREKESGTMEVLLVSPLRPAQIIAGKVIPYLVLSFVNVLTVLVLALTIFGVPVHGSDGLLLAESFIFILTALALGILISTVASDQQTAMMLSLAGLLLPTLILSGFIFPIASMPWPLRAVSNIVPAKWFLIIAKGIMLRGVGLGYLWKETLILIGMGVVLFAAGIRRLNVRLE
ncbi:MAG TPA: ABC transporter permease [Rhodothermales bacterium]|nr:ABC transporter permease [Rhodothermales bacterium]